MSKPTPVPHHLHDPRRAYDQDGQEIMSPTIGSARIEGKGAVEVCCEAPNCENSAVLRLPGLPLTLHRRHLAPEPDLLHAVLATATS